MNLFEKYVTEANEKASELAKNEATLDGGEMAQIRASTVQQERRYGRNGRYRCMRCGRNSEKMKMPGKFEGARWLGKDYNHKLKMETRAFRRARHGEKG